ncbi:MAG: glycerophosphoryl diester phosphodiesterase membrane domain-containing protein [Bacteroidaceae bacterium]|nr:glycerophosphoryl diester phosphodiesterase membrane domain-containing protein [Bacteroidaceae bacterium]
MKQLVIGDIVSRAWDLAVKHWPIFVLLTFVYNMISGFGLNIDQTLYMEGIQNNDPLLISQAITVSPWMAVTFLLAIYLSYVMLNLYVNAHCTGKPYATMAEAFKVDFNQLAIYFCVELVYGIIVAIGCVALIIPGIYLAIRLWYAPLLAATQGASFTEAFSRSWEMTKGHFWELLLLGLTMIGIGILGFCACCVGYFFAAVIIEFMLVISFFVLKPEMPASEATDYVEVQ